MSALTVRWTLGDWPPRRFHPQAFTMLAHSIAWIRLLYPDAQLIVATNNLNERGRTITDLICDHYGARTIDAEPWLPATFDHPKSRTSPILSNRITWWKLAPLRVAPNEHELILDNDVILWRKPAAVTNWLNQDDAMLAAGMTGPNPDWPADQPYGNYNLIMARDHPDLSFNTGIIGWPPNMPALPHPPAQAKARPHHYGNEQGFLATN